MEASGLQIIEINNENKMVPNTPLLETLLNPEIRDKQVCVVSVMGTSRHGKSFLLNFLIRYLSLKYKLKKPDSSKWLDSENDKISGFPCKCGSDRQTVGILMWSEIFTAELPSGEEVAIILLDTQGALDNASAKQQCPGVSAITTLISSIQIYNLKNKPNQFDMECFKSFSGYGLQIEKEDAHFSGAPFQHLCFLIRDWQYKLENGYGREGGERLLNKEILNEDVNIKSLFEKITCFLLPHPGEKVATEPSFDGDFEDINPDFLQYVEEFAPNVLSLENLIPKRINGKIIKVSDLYYFIHQYCQYFMERNVPDLKSMLQVTAEAGYKIASEEALKVYHKVMGEVKHSEAKAKAMENFDKRNVFGGKDLKMSNRRKLNYLLDALVLDRTKLDTTEQQQLNEENEGDNSDTENMGQEKCQGRRSCGRRSAIPLHLQQRIAALLEPSPSSSNQRRRPPLFEIYCRTLRRIMIPKI